MSGKSQKWILNPNYEIYECNFLQGYLFYKWTDNNLYEIGLKCSQHSKKGQNGCKICSEKINEKSP